MPRKRHVVATEYAAMVKNKEAVSVSLNMRSAAEKFIRDRKGKVPYTTIVHIYPDALTEEEYRKVVAKFWQKDESPPPAQVQQQQPVRSKGYRRSPLLAALTRESQLRQRRREKRCGK